MSLPIGYKHNYQRDLAFQQAVLASSPLDEDLIPFELEEDKRANPVLCVKTSAISASFADQTCSAGPIYIVLTQLTIDRRDLDEHMHRVYACMCRIRDQSFRGDAEQRLKNVAQRIALVVILAFYKSPDPCLNSDLRCAIAEIEPLKGISTTIVGYEWEPKWKRKYSVEPMCARFWPTHYTSTKSSWEHVPKSQIQYYEPAFRTPQEAYLYMRTFKPMAADKWVARVIPKISEQCHLDALFNDVKESTTLKCLVEDTQRKWPQSPIYLTTLGSKCTALNSLFSTFDNLIRQNNKPSELTIGTLYEQKSRVMHLISLMHREIQKVIHAIYPLLIVFPNHSTASLAGKHEITLRVFGDGDAPLFQPGKKLQVSETYVPRTNDRIFLKTLIDVPKKLCNPVEWAELILKSMPHIPSLVHELTKKHLLNLSALHPISLALEFHQVASTTPFYQKDFDCWMKCYDQYLNFMELGRLQETLPYQFSEAFSLYFHPDVKRKAQDFFEEKLVKVREAMIFLQIDFSSARLIPHPHTSEFNKWIKDQPRISSHSESIYKIAVATTDIVYQHLKNLKPLAVTSWADL